MLFRSPRALLLENISPVASELLRREGYQVETVASALKEDELIKRLAGVQLLGIAWYEEPVFGFIPSTDPPVQGYGDGVGGPGGAWANYIYP